MCSAMSVMCGRQSMGSCAVCTLVRHVDVAPCIVGYCVQCYECNVWKAEYGILCCMYSCKACRCDTLYYRLLCAVL